MTQSEPMDELTESEPGAPQAEPVATSSEQNSDEIEALKSEIERLKDQALRAMAESENIRRRSERDREDASKYAVSTLARELLNVSDNLGRALGTVTEGQRSDENLKSLIEGIEATERELLAAFERRQIKRIDPLGEKFDPNFHQAMFEVPTEDAPIGTIVQVLQVGYIIYDRLLRPALVSVAKASDAMEHKPIDTKA